MKTDVQNRNEIQLFENETFGKIRTILRDGDPWFVAKDVCDILEVNNSRQAMTRLENFEKNTVILNDGKKGNPNVTIISESGFYALVLSSRKPIAKPFRIWVTSEVLPAIRKTGKYISKTDDEMYRKLDAFLINTNKNLPCVFAQINNIENVLEIQTEKIDSVIDNITLNTRQQEKIHEVARKRINYLLGGAHSEEYKEYSRIYMINLWNGLKSTFHCGSSYKDLNPKDYEKAVEYINSWDYER